MADDSKFTQADIDAAIKSATDKFQEQLDKLEAKNSGLLDDLKKAQREARAAKEIKPEDLTAAEDRAEKAEAALADAQKQLKTIAGERDKATKALEAEQGFTHKLLIQDGLKSALIANGVKDEDFLDSLTAKFAAGASIKVEGDQRTAVYGEKALSDHIKEWAGSDAGKKFVEAANNTGGGAGGSNRGGAGKSMKMSEFNALPPKERSVRMSEGYTLVDDAA